MTQVRFALLRHGVTDWNKQKRIQGRTDIPLSPDTRDTYRHRRVPDEWCDVPWLCSPLTRTRETAKALGIATVQPEPAFIEMDWGGWEGKKLSDLRQTLGKKMQENEDRGWDFRPDQGESPRDVLARVEQFLLQTNHQKFGAVTHKGVIRAIHAAARNWNMLGKSPDRLDWNCLQVFDWSPDDGFDVVALNVALVMKKDTGE
ncbi:histidine phosphatase family protein [Thalassospira sp. MA62]|nr:histidine phosphatase family protein [Thalassospira sp. MA62]